MLRAHSDAPAKHGAEGGNGGDRDEVGRALHPLGDVVDPAASVKGRKSLLNGATGSKPFGQRLRLRPAGRRPRIVLVLRLGMCRPDVVLQPQPLDDGVDHLVAD